MISLYFKSISNININNVSERKYQIDYNESNDKIIHLRHKESMASQEVLALACKDQGIPFDIEDIKRGKHGKPYLDGYPDFHFNISHSKGMLLCATAEEEIGCDIQEVRPIRSKLFCKYATEQEKDIYREQPILLWTLKESYLKLTGQGITRNLKSIEFGRDCLWEGEGQSPVRKVTVLDQGISWELYLLNGRRQEYIYSVFMRSGSSLCPPGLRVSIC